MAVPFIQLTIVVWMLVVRSEAECPCNTTAVWEALSAFYRSTNGPQWTRQGRWFEPGSSVCEWYGVGGYNCSSIELADNNLAGTLPPELAAVTELVVFDLRVNNLSGTLPRDYKSWSNLQRFSVDKNQLVGSLPPEYSAWSLIREFHVNWNALSGTLPDAYSNWTQMNVFLVDNNELSGSLPAAYHRWEGRVGGFNVHTNRLSGSLPDAYASWRGLQSISLYANAFSGTIPSCWSSWSLLHNFGAHNNTLNGTLAPSFSNWTKIRTFSVSMNRLSGSLPMAYFSWRRIEYFEVYSNALEGTIPSEYGSHWLNISRFLAHRNRLNGSIPESLGSWKSLTSLTVSLNLLSGVIPTSFSTMKVLQNLALDNNMLRGTLPLLSASFTLALHNNRGLYGTIPAAMSFSMFVAVCNTSLCGALPPSWRSMFTTFLCQDNLTDAVVKSMGSDRVPEFSSVSISRLLSSCTATSTPPSPSPASELPSSQASLQAVAQQATGSIAVVAAALVFSGVAPVMQVSQRAAAVASRAHACRSENPEGATDAAQLGDVVADNPTQLSVPHDTVPLAVGTVVGNTALLVGVSCLTAFVMRWVPAQVRKCTLTAVFVTTLLFVWSALHVPSIAASTVLLCDAASRISGVPSTSVIAIVGFVVQSVVPAITIVAFVSKRALLSGALCRRSCTWSHSCKSFKNLLDTCTSRTSRWKITTSSAKGLSRLRRGIVSVYETIFQQLLADCGVPHSWMVLHDVLGGLVCGLLLGVASSPSVTCGAVVAAMWALVGLVSVQALIAVAVRPRPTVADCAFQAVMCTWTAVGTLLAALGVEEGSGESALAQSVLCIAWSAPMVALRALRFFQFRSALRMSALESSTAYSPRGKRRRVVYVHSIEYHAPQQVAALRDLIELACKNTQRRVSSSGPVVVV